MYAAILLLASLPGGSGANLNDPIKTADIVRIEWNCCINDDGTVAYAQLIWWDATDDGVRCVGYRMVGASTVEQYRFMEREVRWRADGVEYRVRGMVHGTVTYTADDPEIKDRKRLPSNCRPKIFD